MNTYVCKTCGRMYKGDFEPTSCYACGTRNIEKVDPDEVIYFSSGSTFPGGFEFPNDVRFNSIGKSVLGSGGLSLYDHQNEIMKKVKNS